MLRSFFTVYEAYNKMFVCLVYINTETGKIRKNKGAYHVEKRKISVRSRCVGA